MKITDLQLDTYRWPRPIPIRNGRHVYDTAGLNVVSVTTDDGLQGLGLFGGFQDVGGIGKAVVDRLRPVVIGQNPLNNERIWDDMWQPKLVGRRGITTWVISGIDIALWDIKGKAARMPVSKLLGGFSDRVPAYIAGGYYEEGKGLQELAEETHESVAMGTRAIKMKIGGVPIPDDVERVKIVREAAGPKIKLMVDANCAYRYYEAIDIAKKIEPYDIYWFEEPVNPDDYEGLKLVSQATSIPIAAGENEYTRYGFRELIERRCAAIIQPDAMIMGGITEFMKVAALAQAHDLPISPHGNQDIHIHLATAIPNGLTLEFYRQTSDPMWGKMFKGTLELKDGYVSPPERPGIGIELNEAALKKYRVS